MSNVTSRGLRCRLGGALPVQRRCLRVLVKTATALLRPSTMLPGFQTQSIPTCRTVVQAQSSNGLPAAPGSMPGSELTAATGRTALWRMNKAKLVAELELRREDTTGTVPALHTGAVPLTTAAAASSQETGTSAELAQASVDLEAVQLLRAEVARLEAAMAETDAQLRAATSERGSERQELAELVGDMTQLRDEWQQEVQLLDMANSELQSSETELAELRGAQDTFAERLGMLQSSLKDKVADILQMKEQLTGTEPVYALSGTFAQAKARGSTGNGGRVVTLERPATTEEPVGVKLPARVQRPAAEEPVEEARMPSAPSARASYSPGMDGARFTPAEGTARAAYEVYAAAKEGMRKGNMVGCIVTMGAMAVGSAYDGIRSAVPWNQRLLLDAATAVALLAIVAQHA
ncbi:hypothetical protein WJX72_002498 [[Myrmecia] bisecta]|uniref:Uncharacterized protein n=1 Tax=[Myrmecia] bisecta TaxID=41462 RepID=A0AAW1PCN8_9CHLO